MDVLVVFNYFLLSQQWGPGVCCHQPCVVVYPNISLHGLWPNDDNGSYPAFCPGPRFDPNQLPHNISAAWYSFTGANLKFYQHEWNKHGTCSNLEQLAYFTTALQLHQRLNATISTDPVQLQKQYPAPIALVCDAACVLREIHSCWDLTFQPQPCMASEQSCQSCTRLELCLHV